MSEFISERERERMAEFARTPAYQRDPEQLIPEEEEPEG
jgi:hypothetical protein